MIDPKDYTKVGAIFYEISGNPYWLSAEGLEQYLGAPVAALLEQGYKYDPSIDTADEEDYKSAYVADLAFMKRTRGVTYMPLTLAQWRTQIPSKAAALLFAAKRREPKFTPPVSSAILAPTPVPIPDRLAALEKEVARLKDVVNELARRAGVMFL